MNARGTRRPHSTRAYKSPRKPSRSSGGGGDDGGTIRNLLGCGVIIIALAALPVAAIADVIWSAVAR